MKLEGEWELSPEELATIFQTKGWPYLVDQGFLIPNPDTIKAVIAKLVGEVIRTGKTQAQGGRFLVWKDPDLPGSWDVWLNVGFVWDPEQLEDGHEIIRLDDDDDDGSLV